MCKVRRTLSPTLKVKDGGDISRIQCVPGSATFLLSI